jgi:hypothetical protein
MISKPETELYLTTIMNNSKPENRSPLKFFLIVFGLSIPLWIIDLMIDAKRTS